MEELCGEVVCRSQSVGAEPPANVWITRLTWMRNRGELAEGWYDPATKQKAVQSSNTVSTKSSSPARQRRPSPDYASRAPPQDADTDTDEDAIGPALPSQDVRSRRAGPAVPSLQDLELRNGTILTSFQPCKPC